jgi:hypothetical protein
MMFVRTRVWIPYALLAAGLGLVEGLVAAPPLTTIQDVLYKADGTRFNGAAAITWKSFEAADSSAITMHSITVKIVDGQFRVQLVPNANSTPQTYYAVRFTSDGKIQFDETWSVPNSVKTLRLRDVRVAVPLAPGQETAPGPIQMEDVVGLVADLNARPLRGPGYLPGRAAVIGESGAVEAATGSPADCVRVDGTSGPCGSGGVLNLSFVDNENPAGAVDGANNAFTLAAAPAPAASLALYRNGMFQKPEQDYTLAERVITFVTEAIPQPGDTVLASYRLQRETLMAAGPEVLCSSEGTLTSSTAPSSLGSCAIGAGTLNAGDRVEVQFDFLHQGATAAFTFEVRWGSTTMVQRTAGAGDALVTGRGEAAVTGGGTQISVQTWGTVLPLGAGVAEAADAPGGQLVIDFLGNLEAAGGDSVKLRHYTVIRYPAI